MKEEKASCSGELFEAKQHLIPSTSSSSSASGKQKKPSTTKQIKEKIKSFSQMPKDDHHLTPWSKLKRATVVSLGGSYSSLNNNIAEDSPKLSKTSMKSSMPVDLNTVTSKLDESTSISKSSAKHATTKTTTMSTSSSSISHGTSSSHSFKNEQQQQKTSVSDSELKSDTSTASTASTVKTKHKPKPFKLCEPKSYRSVDDLSPEYSGLPFVKKLKILNERQKLAELESVIQTRSMSLDCTDSSNSNEMIEVLTRSQSEASCMIRPKITGLLAPDSAHHGLPPKSPLSPESNETLERKKLKSILKKLSEDRLSQNVSSVKSQGDRQDMKRLMRAQTLEGYVARRTKFTKSVTFNHTLSSPPCTTTLTEEPEESLQKFSPSPTTTPVLSSYPPVFSPSLNHTNAQQDKEKVQTSSTHDSISPQNLLIHQQNINININSDMSTNRFNYSDDVAVLQQHQSSDETTTTSDETVLPPLPPPSAAQPQLKHNYNNYTDTGTLAFVSDNYGERKLIKGTFVLFTHSL